MSIAGENRAKHSCNWTVSEEMQNPLYGKNLMPSPHSIPLTFHKSGKNSSNEKNFLRWCTTTTFSSVNKKQQCHLDYLRKTGNRPNGGVPFRALTL